METIFIDDGKSRTRTITAKPGFHPQAEVVFRPALSLKRHEYRSIYGRGEPKKIEDAMNATILSHTHTINGERLSDKKQVERLDPNVKEILHDLILGYEPNPESKLVVPVEAELEEDAEMGN